MRKKMITSKLTEPSISFSHSQLREALLFLEDTMDRALMPWFLIEETGRQVFYQQPELHLTEITAGVKLTDVNAGLGILTSVVPEAKISDSSINFEKDGVPIRLKIFKKEADVFKYPDPVNYDVATFYLPNPFIHYFKNKEQYE